MNRGFPLSSQGIQSISISSWMSICIFDIWYDMLLGKISLLLPSSGIWSDTSWTYTSTAGGAKHQQLMESRSRGIYIKRAPHRGNSDVLRIWFKLVRAQHQSLTLKNTKKKSVGSLVLEIWFELIKTPLGSLCAWLSSSTCACTGAAHGFSILGVQTLSFTSTQHRLHWCARFYQLPINQTTGIWQG